MVLVSKSNYIGCQNISTKPLNDYIKRSICSIFTFYPLDVSSFNFTYFSPFILISLSSLFSVAPSIAFIMKTHLEVLKDTIYLLIFIPIYSIILFLLNSCIIFSISFITIKILNKEFSVKYFGIFAPISALVPIFLTVSLLGFHTFSNLFIFACVLVSKYFIDVSLELLVFIDTKRLSYILYIFIFISVYFYYHLSYEVFTRFSPFIFSKIFELIYSNKLS